MQVILVKQEGQLMFKRPGYFFALTNVGNVGGSFGSDQLKPVNNESTTSVVRSGALYAPSFSTISVDIQGTATVQVILNPFDGCPSAKDKVLVTLNSSGTYITPGAGAYLLNVTAVTGTVSARLSYDQELDDC